MNPGICVNWPDPNSLRRSMKLLASSPPLVSHRHVQLLHQELADVAIGNAMVLQGGDCAESFESNNLSYIAGQVELLTELADVFREMGSRVVPIVRGAGQYFKPRSSDYERLPSGIRVLKYRGDGVNGHRAIDSLRTPDAHRLVEAYCNSRRTLQYMQRLDALARAERGAAYVSHEALLTEYEQPLTRRIPALGQMYSGSTHFPWIGVRSNSPFGPQVCWASNIVNPLGVKIGPNTSEDQILTLAERLDPLRTLGRLTLIVRLGAASMAERLPRMIRVVKEAGWTPIWMCDPMHGNSIIRSCDGVRTRALTAIIEELRTFFEIHFSIGTHAAGIHLELTHQPVTECVRTCSEIETTQLTDYRSLGDPRLNGYEARNVILSIRDLVGNRPSKGASDIHWKR